MTSTDDLLTAGSVQARPSDSVSAIQEFQQEEPEDSSSTLPPPDHGHQAWLFLAGSFMIECMIWGFPFSYGIFLKYYESNPPFQDHPAGLSAIGTSAMGIMYLGAPLVGYCLHVFPTRRRQMQAAGLALMILTLVISSFSNKVWHLVLTQGILFGLAGGFIYLPTIQYMDEWFVRRKGFAFGVMWAGTGVSGVCIPLIMEWGLKQFGFATMLRAWAVVLLVLTGPLLYFVKERIPVSRSYQPRRINVSFFRSTRFWVLEGSIILQGLGFFMPGLYLPSYAESLGASALKGALTVALFNMASVFGALIFGTLTDRLHVTSAMFYSSAGATIAVFFLWGFAVSFPMLCMFSLLYGLFAGGYSSTWWSVTREIRKDDDRSEHIILFGVLAAGRGVGSVAAGPLSEALLSHKPWKGEALLGYGTGYGPLIVLTGTMSLLGGSSWVARRLGMI